MLASRMARYVAVALGLGLAAIVLLYPSDDKRARAALEALIADPNVVASAASPRVAQHTVTSAPPDAA